MGCTDCGATVVTIPLNILRPRNWPEKWKRACRPNDLLLLKGRPGVVGGILRIKYPGAFLTLTPDQVWRGEPFTWPVAGSKIKTARIVGTKIKMSLV